MFKSVSEKSKIRFLLAVAGLGGLLYGVDFGVIAAAEPYLMALGFYSGSRVSLIVGAVMMGGLFSSLTAGILCDLFGRKKMIAASSMMFLVAVPIVCLSVDSFWVLFSGRMLQGMSAGYMAVVMPMYLTETLPPEIRGRGTGVFQFILGLGLVVAAGVGCLVASVYGAADAKGLGTDGMVSAWGANFWWTTVPVGILFAGSFFLKESPVWLGRRAHSDRREATQPVACAEKKESVFTRRYMLPLLLAVLVLTFNKTTGMSSFTSYLVSILQQSGFEGMFANYGQFMVKLTNMVATVFAATVIDRVGRTRLLKIGTGGMTIGLACIGGVFLVVERFGVQANNFTGLLTLISFFAMQIFYALGPGICVWLVLSELMPSRIRANGMAFALFMNQLVACALASTFRPWVEAWGWSSMFFFFAANGILYFVTAFFIPETKGKPLEELERLFEKKTDKKTRNP